MTDQTFSERRAIRTLAQDAALFAAPGVEDAYAVLVAAFELFGAAVRPYVATQPDRDADGRYPREISRHAALEAMRMAEHVAWDYIDAPAPIDPTPPAPCTFPACDGHGCTDDDPYSGHSPVAIARLEATYPNDDERNAAIAANDADVADDDADVADDDDARYAAWYAATVTANDDDDAYGAAVDADAPTAVDGPTIAPDASVGDGEDDTAAARLHCAWASCRRLFTPPAFPSSWYQRLYCPSCATRMSGVTRTEICSASYVAPGRYPDAEDGSAETIAPDAFSGHPEAVTTMGARTDGSPVAPIRDTVPMAAPMRTARRHCAWSSCSRLFTPPARRLWSYETTYCPPCAERMTRLWGTGDDQS